MAAVATWQDVAVALGRPTSDFSSDQQAQVTYWLNGAELVIKSRLGDPALLDQDTLQYVETEAVAEKVRRAGRDESSITVSVDDGSVTRRYETAMTLDDISTDLWSLLSPVGSSTAYTIAVSSPLDIT